MNGRCWEIIPIIEDIILKSNFELVTFVRAGRKSNATSNSLVNSVRSIGVSLIVCDGKHVGMDKQPVMMFSCNNGINFLP